MKTTAEDSTVLCLRCQIEKTENCPLCKAYEMAKGDFELAKIYYVKKYGTHQKKKKNNWVYKLDEKTASC